MALLVEHAVIGQQLLAVPGHHATIAEHGRGVVDALGGVLRVTDDDVDAGDLPADFLQPCRHHRWQAGALQQIVRWIAQQRELREHHQIGLQPVACIVRGCNDLGDITLDVTHPEIQLGGGDTERTSHKNFRTKDTKNTKGAKNGKRTLLMNFKLPNS